jgi:hypothetical protein
MEIFKVASLLAVVLALALVANQQVCNRTVTCEPRPLSVKMQRDGDLYVGNWDTNRVYGDWLIETDLITWTSLELGDMLCVCFCKGITAGRSYDGRHTFRLLGILPQSPYQAPVASCVAHDNSPLPLSWGKDWSDTYISRR